MYEAPLPVSQSLSYLFALTGALYAIQDHTPSANFFIFTHPKQMQ